MIPIERANLALVEGDYVAPELRKGKQPPHNGDMEARLTAVEQAVVRLDAILPTLATKAELAELRSDVHKGFADQTKWIVGTGFAGIAVFITVMTFVLNNAVPKAPPAPQPQQAPIIINVPAPQAAPPGKH